MWRVRRRDRSGFVLVTVEFQSRVDRTMALRVLEYSTLLYRELLRNRELRRAARAESYNKDRKDRRRRAGDEGERNPAEDEGAVESGAVQPRGTSARPRAPARYGRVAMSAAV